MIVLKTLPRVFELYVHCLELIEIDKAKNFDVINYWNMNDEVK